MIRFALLLLLILPSIANSQVISLSEDGKHLSGEKPGVTVEGDYTLLVTKLPVVLRAEKGHGYYDWKLKYNVESTEARNVCTITAAPDGDYLVSVNLVKFHVVGNAVQTTTKIVRVKFRLRARSNIDDESDDDDDDEDDGTKPKIQVDNTYDVGQVAFDRLPRKNKTVIRNVSRIFDKSAGFLEGVPSLKAIYFEDPKAYDDPKRSVLAWQKLEIKKAIGSDAKWMEWKVAVNAAFQKSQETNRPMARQKWAAAFREVAKALEAVK